LPIDAPFNPLNPEPDTVITVPAAPDVGEKLAMYGVSYVAAVADRVVAAETAAQRYRFARFDMDGTRVFGGGNPLRFEDECGTRDAFYGQ
jgi:hypothetical protein